MRSRGTPQYMRVLWGRFFPFLRWWHLVSGDENIFASKANAIPAIFERLDHERCAYCSARIFNVCRHIEYKGDGRPSGVEERATVRQITD
ncbi:MAG: hypothetical protein V3T85_01635 [Acidiferrobacterales bacterium]